MGIIDLFRPKWKRSNYKKAIAYLETINDENFYHFVAKSPAHLKTSIAAVKLITDETLLKDIATMTVKYIGRDNKEIQRGLDGNPRWDICEEAISGITDEKYLKSYVLHREVVTSYSSHPMNIGALFKAAKSIKDPKLIVEIISSNCYPSVREQLIDKLEDATTLTKAAMGLTSQQSNSWLRYDMAMLKTIIKRIDDFASLIEISSSLEENKIEKGRAAKEVWEVMNLINKQLKDFPLKQIIKGFSNSSDELKISILRDHTFPYSDIKKILSSPKHSSKVKLAALDNIKKKDDLVDLAISPLAEKEIGNPNSHNRPSKLYTFFMHRIKSQQHLIKIAKSESCASVEAMKRINKSKLKDKKLLGEIISSEKFNRERSKAKEEEERKMMKEAWELDRKYR